MDKRVMQPVETRGRRPSRTALRLAAAFGAVLALFGIALAVVLYTFDRSAELDTEVARLDHAQHTGHLTSAMVREQYIQQAHALIHWDASHLDAYDQVQRRTRVATQALLGIARAPEERARAGEIARRSQASHDLFVRQVVPALARDDREQARALGERLEAELQQVVAINDDLNHSFEARSTAAHDRAVALRVTARHAIIVCFALAILLAGGVGLLLTRSILRPVGELQAGARRVGAGDLSARIDIAGHDEFAELARAFNQMTENLARDQEALLRAQKLASIGELAAGVAHEINNPLGVMLGYLKLLRKDDPREELGIIEDEARQCQRIVQGLLDLARSPRLHIEEVDLAELARDAVERLADSGKVAGRQVEVPPPGASAPARADASRLRQVIANVLTNAVEATPEGGKIVIEARAEGRDAELVIADTGPGIPADVRPRIFDPFFTTKRAGTGLGLAIVQTIVEAHGGSVVIDSAPGAGTRVTLRLPREEPGGAPT